MSFSKFSTFSTPSYFGTQQNSHLTVSRSADSTCFENEDNVNKRSYSLRNSWFSGTPWSETFLPFQGSLGSKKYQIWKTTLPHWNSPSIQMLYPKLMVMVSFCWKINFLPSKIKNKFVLLTRSLKLTIKVVAFFLGHPVYELVSVPNESSCSSGGIHSCHWFSYLLILNFIYQVNIKKKIIPLS